MSLGIAFNDSMSTGFDHRPKAEPYSFRSRETGGDVHVLESARAAYAEPPAFVTPIRSRFQLK